MRTLLLAAAATAAFVSPAAAQTAQCRLRLDAVPSSWIIRGYDPYGESPSNATFDLAAINDGDKECVFYPVFTLKGEPYGLKGATGRPTTYHLMDLYGGYDATPIAGRTQARVTRRSVVVGPHSQQTLQYALVVDTDGIDSAGIRDQTVDLEAQDKDGLPMAGRQLVLGIDVMPSATLGLTGAFRVSGSQAVVDLGDLKEGPAEVPLQLRVQSTGRYRLTLDSQNKGHLQLPGTAWAVSYGMRLGSQSIDLSSGSGNYVSPSEAHARNDSLPIHFRIGNVDDLRAGTYSDVISVSVEPL